MLTIGIDPGVNGSAALLEDDGSLIDVIEWNKNTEREIADGFDEWTWSSRHIKAYIEQVHSMPGQGVVSSFKFGKNLGFWIGLLTVLKIPYEFVTPQKWQKSLGCMTKGDKNVTKSKAQQLYPNEKITHSNADAILIAVYGCRNN